MQERRLFYIAKRKTVVDDPETENGYNEDTCWLTFKVDVSTVLNATIDTPKSLASLPYAQTKCSLPGQTPPPSP